MQSKEYWESVYSTKTIDEVSWFQEHAVTSLKLIQQAGVSTEASIIDVGGGASTLVDDLLNHEFQSVTILDLSESALAAAKARLDARAGIVNWVQANIITVELPFQAYDVWHDRAVFHFLTTAEERQAYLRAVLNAVKPGGFVIVSTFAEDGPTKCSGLPVMRYSIGDLHAEFGSPFQLLKSEREIHKTPAGNEQRFIYCLCQRAAA